jgi:N-acetylmuramoyl-L-alanine amidase
MPGGGQARPGGGMAMLAAWAVGATLTLSTANSVPSARGGRAAGAPAALVVVDPGHGGKDEGASHGGVQEERVNLETARVLASVLRHHGYRVLLTRERGCEAALYAAAGAARSRAAAAGAVAAPTAAAATGEALWGRRCRVNLRDRVLRAAFHHASAFISLHCDHYADPSVRGPRTYYGRGSEVQRALAESIQDELDALRERPFRPAASDHFVLLAQPDVPAVTVELGFLTNPRERRLLTTAAYRRTLAEAVARGFERFARSHALLPAPTVDVASVESRWRAAHARAVRRR